MRRLTFCMLVAAALNFPALQMMGGTQSNTSTDPTSSRIYVQVDAVNPAVSGYTVTYYPEYYTNVVVNVP
jgi:hypothetical protein